MRRTAFVALGAALFVGASLTALRPFTPSAEPGVVMDTTEIRFADGSRVIRATSDALVSVVEAGPARIITSLDSGRIEVEVAPNQGRVFRVVAGSVSVEALGTAFDVDRDSKNVRVLVRHGRVRVDWPRGSRELGAGEGSVYPPEALAAASGFLLQEPNLESDPPAPGATAIAQNAKARAPSWKDLALEGKHAAAYALLRDQGNTLRDPEDLLLAADVARLSGHGAEAVPFLERLLRERGTDARAPLAAFALGRVLMTSLGQPEKAAQAFADARRRARGGSLAEDALAREIEAWSRAGAKARARERAEEYLRLYPKGQRLSAVKTFGGFK
jgi:transmembrane sensor